MIPPKPLAAKPPKPLKSIRARAQAKRTTSPIQKAKPNPQLMAFKNPGIPRKFPKQNPIHSPQNTAPSGRWDEEVIKEMGAGGAGGGGLASGMSIGGGSVSPIAPPDASAAYSLQRKKLQNILRRKRPK
jgi:hypothetical protein